jgi:PE family
MRRLTAAFPVARAAKPNRVTLAFHAQFVQTLTGGAAAYAATEAANASPLQTLEQDVFWRDQCAHRGGVGASADR